jgi:hypothetical protein
MKMNELLNGLDRSLDVLNAELQVRNCTAKLASGSRLQLPQYISHALLCL